MPTDKIDLKTSLEDTPQVQAQVSKLEGTLAPMKDCTVLLRDTFQACSVHQQKVCEGTDTLSKLLTSFQEDALTEDDSFLSKSFGSIGRYLNELHSCQEMLSTQLQNAVIELLSQFISNDFSEIDQLKENFESAWHDHEQATVKYSRVTKKKDSEKTRFEANSDLFTARKKYYESSLNYYTKLNGFKLKWKYSLMEPLLTYMHAQMAYFKAGHEVLSKELGKVLNELNTEVQRYHDQYQQEMIVLSEEKEEIELSFPSLCLPDPDPNDPFIDYQPPKTNITSRSGYLFLKVQKTGFSSQWDRGYFYTKKGHLYSHFPQRAAEALFLLKGAEASIGEMDDRRYVFQVTHMMLKRPVYFLAENDVERDEWVAVINNNNGQERSFHQTHSTTVTKDAEVIKQERDRIRDWVKKEIHDPPKRERSSTKYTRGNTSSAPAISLPSLRQTKPPPPALQPRQPKLPPKRPDLPKPHQVLSPSPSQLPEPLQPQRLPASPQSTHSVGISEKFFVKYLGHTEIKDGNAPNVITDTIRKVMAARSVQNVKSAIDIEMTVAQKSIVFLDIGARKAIGQIQLKGVLQYSTHPDNIKLLGVVNRSLADSEKTRYICHVLESETEGSKICKTIESAVKTALKLPDSKHHKPVKGGYQAQPPRPPPPIYKPTYSTSASGYVTFDNNQVIPANTTRTIASTAEHNSSSAPSLSSHSNTSPASSSSHNKLSVPPPPSSSSSSHSSSMGFVRSIDNFTDQEKLVPDNHLADNFATEDVNGYTADIDDLPPLDSPPPVPESRTMDSSYISDSTFNSTPSEPFANGSGFLPNDIDAADTLDTESVWSSLSGQPSTMADSGYYKTDEVVSSISEKPEADDIDLFQDTFNDFSSSNIMPSADFFQSNQQMFTVSSSGNNSLGNYYTTSTSTSQSSSGITKQSGYTSMPSIGATSNTGPTTMGSSSYTTSNYAPAPQSNLSQNFNTQASNNQIEEDYDWGDPVDLLSDLAEPFNSDGSFQPNYSASQNTKSDGYYHTDQTTTTPASTVYYSTNSSMKGGYSSMDQSTPSGGGGGPTDDDDDGSWLPPLPDEDEFSQGQVPTSYTGSSYLTHSRKN